MISRSILIVEDNPEYLAAALSCFNIYDRNGVLALFGYDYKTAIAVLEATPEPFRPKGALIDCFFPKQTGSGDTSLGGYAIEKMALSDPTEIRRRAFLEEAGKYVDTNDPDMRTYIMMIADSNSGSPSEYPVLKALKAVSETEGRSSATSLTKDGLKLVTQKHLPHFKDYYGSLHNAIKESEANQPLGVLVAEKAEEMGIPFALVTSTYHHDALTQPIVNYAARQNWPGVIDCMPSKENEKATPEFWERAYRMLQE